MQQLRILETGAWAGVAPGNNESRYARENLEKQQRVLVCCAVYYAKLQMQLCVPAVNSKDITIL